MRISRIIILLLFCLAGQLISTGFAFASTTDGTIDSTYKYAWSENAGWINFSTTNGDVHITDSGLSGYALSETIGWIYLGDVTNDGEGNLSGFAWSENAGWIKFNPTSGGVVINSYGEFTGSALGENIGWIIFDGDYTVKTDWRPRSARPACNNATDDDSDGKTDYPNDPGCDSLDDNDETDPSSGGGMPPAAYSPPSSPSPSSQNPKGEFNILINNNDEYTDKLEVNLTLLAGKDTKRMSISNFSDFRNASQIPYEEKINWNLCSELGGQTSPDSCSEGEYTVYAKFYTQWGQSSQIVSDSTIYQEEEKKEPVPEMNISELKAKIAEITALISGLQSRLAEVLGKVSYEGCAITSFDRNLSQGMIGDDVKCLQIILNSDPKTRLADSGVGSPWNETNYFGSLTKSAVIRFQEKYADEILSYWELIKGTGFVGKTTRDKINEFLDR